MKVLALSFDLEFIRTVFLQIENGPSDSDWVDISIPGHDDGTIAQCVQQLHQLGYIEAAELWTLSGEVWKPVRLTWKSQALLDGTRSGHTWQKAKGMVEGSGVRQELSAMLDALKNALAEIAKEQEEGDDEEDS